MQTKRLIVCCCWENVAIGILYSKVNMQASKHDIIGTIDTQVSCRYDAGPYVTGLDSWCQLCQSRVASQCSLTCSCSGLLWDSCIRNQLAAKEARKQQQLSDTKLSKSILYKQWFDQRAAPSCNAVASRHDFCRCSNQAMYSCKSLSWKLYLTFYVVYTLRQEVQELSVGRKGKGGGVGWWLSGDYGGVALLTNRQTVTVVESESSLCM